MQNFFEGPGIYIEIWVRKIRAPGGSSHINFNRDGGSVEAQKGAIVMKPVTNKALIARLNEIYALYQEGEKEGIEMLKNAWFYDEKDQAFYLRVMNGNKPGAYLHRVETKS